MAVAIDTSAIWSNPNSSGANTLSYTMGSVSNGIIVVVIATGSITGVTYDGAAMTKLADSVNTTFSYYYLQNPTSGTHNAVVTRTGSPGTDIDGFIISFSGAKQSGNPFGTVQANSGSSKTGLTNSFTTLGIGSMILDILNTNGSPLSAPSPVTATGTGHVVAQQNYSGGGDRFGIVGGYTPAATATSYSVGYSWTSISSAANWNIDYYELLIQPTGTAYTLTASEASFSLTGYASLFVKALHMTLTYGSFALSGIASAFVRARKLTAAFASFALTGFATALNWPHWSAQGKSSATWDNSNKSSAPSWDTTDKSSASWSGTDKSSASWSSTDKSSATWTPTDKS